MNSLRGFVNKYITYFVYPPPSEPGSPKGHVLVINGHPNSEDSYSAELTRATVKGLLRSGHEVRVVNVGDGSFNPIMSADEHKHIYELKYQRPNDLEPYINLIRWADRLVWVYPTWWHMMPGTMKSFIDRAFAAHVAYEPPLQVGGSLKQLLDIKKVGVVTTWGGPLWQSIAPFDLGRRLLGEVIPTATNRQVPQVLFMKLANVYESERRRVNFLKKVEEVMATF